jgi:hypothetical protein
MMSESGFRTSAPRLKRVLGNGKPRLHCQAKLSTSSCFHAINDPNSLGASEFLIFLGIKAQ